MKSPHNPAGAYPEGRGSSRGAWARGSTRMKRHPLQKGRGPLCPGEKQKGLGCSRWTRTSCLDRAPSPRNYLKDDTMPLAAVQLRALNHATISARNSISNCSNVLYRHWSRNKVGWAKCIFIFSFCILCTPIRESFSCLNKYK